MDQLLDCGLPLQDLLGRNGANEVVLDIIYHAAQQLEKMLPHRMANGEPLYKVSTAALNCLQMHNIVLKYLVHMEVHIGRPSTLEVCWIKVSTCLKWVKKETTLLTRSGTMVEQELLPTSNLVLKVPSVGDGPGRKFKHCISFWQGNKEKK